MPLIEIETHAGEPIQAGLLKVTPFSKALILRLPGFPGGLIWNRPASLLVQTADGQEQVLPVADVTRRAQWLLLGAGLLGAALIWLLYRR
jgi:hypothetical protein